MKMKFLSKKNVAILLSATMVLGSFTVVAAANTESGKAALTQEATEGSTPGSTPGIILRLIFIFFLTFNLYSYII